MSGAVSVAVVGLGFGASHARVLNELPEAKLAAVCDTDAARLAEVASKTGAQGFTDVREMLRSVPLDAVVIAVPPRLHEPVARAVIAAGCAVLVEKPLAPTLDEGARLAEAASKANVPLMAGHIERYNAAIIEMGRRVAAGDIGAVVQMSARRLAYFVERARDVDVGVIQDLAYHDIDIMRYISGTEVESAYAQTHSGAKTPYDDALLGTLRFAAPGGGRGALGSLEVNWLSPRKVRDLDVLGEAGLLSADYGDFRNAKLRFQPAQSVRESAPAEGPMQMAGLEPPAAVDVQIEAQEPLVRELADFVRAVRDGAPMPVTVEDTLATLAVVDALAESARTGLPVVPERV